MGRGVRIEMIHLCIVGLEGMGLRSCVSLCWCMFFFFFFHFSFSPGFFPVRYLVSGEVIIIVN